MTVEKKIPGTESGVTKRDWTLRVTSTLLARERWRAWNQSGP